MLHTYRIHYRIGALVKEMIIVAGSLKDAKKYFNDRLKEYSVVVESTEELGKK